MLKNRWNYLLTLQTWNLFNCLQFTNVGKVKCMDMYGLVILKLHYMFYANFKFDIINISFWKKIMRLDPRVLKHGSCYNFMKIWCFWQPRFHWRDSFLKVNRQAKNRFKKKLGQSTFQVVKNNMSFLVTFAPHCEDCFCKAFSIINFIPILPYLCLKGIVNYLFFYLY